MKTAFNDRSKLNPIQQQHQAKVETILGKIGPSEAVDRFLSKYGNVRTRSTYSYWLEHYLRWLKEARGVDMTPDELVTDNLECVHGSSPTDIKTKRRHTDWLSAWVNGDMMKEGAKEATRHIAAATVKEFYKRNDSALFGDFDLAEDETQAPDKALKAEDIRLVLKSMTANVRGPLLFEWQSGIEISRVVTLTWGRLGWTPGSPTPFPIELYGRKSHRKTYSTFIGRDTALHLKALGAGAPDSYIFRGKCRGEVVSHAWLNEALKRAAAPLMKEKLIDDYPRSSWRSHMLRHSFKTEGEHALGGESKLIEFFMGHDGGIEWKYDHRDQTHPEDLVQVYQKIEPFVSLDPDEASLRNEFEAREATLRSDFETRLSRLEGQIEKYAKRRARP